ncbi:hypothetical protein BDV06DRAFT_181229 [Aspergillus oleicola]
MDGYCRLPLRSQLSCASILPRDRPPQFDFCVLETQTAARTQPTFQSPAAAKLHRDLSKSSGRPGSCHCIRERFFTQSGTAALISIQVWTWLPCRSMASPQ